MALALVTVLVAIVAISVIEQFDELVASVDGPSATSPRSSSASRSA